MCTSHMGKEMATDFSTVLTKIDFVKSTKWSLEDIQYGTAGFRTNADGLDYVLYRVGLLAVLRSKFMSGKVIGLMITASHNPEQDNGVKLVDPKGEMLEASWEELATRVANAENDELVSELTDIVNNSSIDWSVNATVYLGRDTRSSSPRLSDNAKAAIEALGGNVIDYGVVTTPMLHFFVAEANANPTAGVPSKDIYYSKLANAFLQANSENIAGNYSKTVHFDGANGVGAVAMKELNPLLKDYLNISVFNVGTGRLNYMCGSDFVKVSKRAPDGVPIETDVKSCSVDGDADRLIYFYIGKDHILHMLDGDKISTLLAAYLMDLLRESGLQLNLGLVHTAYANSAATDYISEQLKIPLACTSTGVKHLHHKALEFDIGVYFEANGHGTVVYSDKAIKLVRESLTSPDLDEGKKAAAKRLLNFINLTNQVVGDALSDMLLVETVLRARGWSLADWEKCYTDLPNRLSKVSIQDRDLVTTTDAARRVVTPVGLQEEIDRLVAKYNKGRSFVRSSGTEDVVRVYAEASTQGDADKLANDVAVAVYNMAKGVGEPPKLGN